jgi:hypothetical protein
MTCFEWSHELHGNNNVLCVFLNDVNTRQTFIDIDYFGADLQDKSHVTPQDVYCRLALFFLCVILTMCNSTQPCSVKHQITLW